MKTFDIKTKLAPTPTELSKYYKKIQTKNGNTIHLADPNIIRALVACMNMNAVNGGAACHYGGPAAFAEINSTIHGYCFEEAKKLNKEHYDCFHIINDAGHCENGIYALKAMYKYADLSFHQLKSFRSITSKLTGHGESHLFPEGVYLSNGPLGSAIPQAQGLAMADKLSGIERTTIVMISDGACMEGEAKEAFTAIPGLFKKSKLAPFICVLSDNNTKLSGRIDNDSYSMEDYFTSLAAQGWKVLKVEKGNDLQSVYEAFEKANELAKTGPVLIHAKTTKGIGTKKTIESSSGGHGFPLKKASELRAFVNEILSGQLPEDIDDWINELEKNEETTNNTVNEPSGVAREKIQIGVSAAMIKKIEEGKPVVSISSDLAGSTGVKGFQDKYPDASFDIGVAEANMISVAAGFSKQGYIPVVDTFAQFGVTKGALPLTMANLSEAPIIAIFSHTGFQDAADGASHQALSYIAMLASIPNVNVYCLTCSSEAEALVSQAIDAFSEARENQKTPKSYVFFLGRENFPRYFSERPHYELNKSQVLFDNTDNFNQKVCIFSPGSLLEEGLIAAELLEKDQIGSIVINPSIMNHTDLDTIEPYINKSQGKIFVVEDHQKKGGYASLLFTSLHNSGINFQGRSLGVKSRFGQSAYTAKELYKKHELDAQSIASFIKENSQ